MPGTKILVIEENGNISINMWSERYLELYILNNLKSEWQCSQVTTTDTLLSEETKISRGRVFAVRICDKYQYHIRRFKR